MQNVLETEECTRWLRVKPTWRSMERETLPLAFHHLKEMLSAEEYDRIVAEWRAGHREVRVENGFVTMCYKPGK
jgi:hypothetical protein